MSYNVMTLMDELELPVTAYKESFIPVVIENHDGNWFHIEGVDTEETADGSLVFRLIIGKEFNQPRREDKG